MSSATSHGQSTFFDGTDLEKMTEQMAASLAADPEVAAAVKEQGRLKVVIMPVENYLQGEILPRGTAEEFVAQVRILLGKNAPASFQFITNRRDYNYIKREREDLDAGPSPDLLTADYTLTARFSSLADENRKSKSAFYVCRYELVSLRDRSTLWEASYNLRKKAARNSLD